MIDVGEPVHPPSPRDGSARRLLDGAVIIEHRLEEDRRAVRGVADDDRALRQDGTHTSYGMLPDGVPAHHCIYVCAGALPAGPGLS